MLQTAHCIFSVLKLKTDVGMRRSGSSSTSETGKGEEVVMGTNQACETVELRYQSRRQPQGSNREEPVYELPAT